MLRTLLFIYPLLSFFDIKMSGLDANTQVSKIFLHHVRIEVELVVLVQLLFFQILVQKLLKESLIEAIGCGTSHEKSDRETNISLAHDVGELVVDDTIADQCEEKLADAEFDQVLLFDVVELYVVVLDEIRVILDQILLQRARHIVPFESIDHLQDGIILE